MAERVKLQSQNTALLLGAGYVAKAMMAPLREAGYHVIATNRSGADVSPADQTLKLNGKVNAKVQAAFETADLILTSIPPKGDPVKALTRLSPVSYTHLTLPTTPYV